MKGFPNAWQKTELARHPQRPQTLDYIDRLFTDFSEIHGDRTSVTMPPSFAEWLASTAKKFWSSALRRAAT